MPELMYNEDDMDRLSRQYERAETQLIEENRTLRNQVQELKDQILTLQVLVDSCETCRHGAEVGGAG